MVEKCRYVSKNLSKSVPHETSSGNIEIIAAVGKAPGGIDYTISGFLNRIVVEQPKRKKSRKSCSPTGKGSAAALHQGVVGKAPKQFRLSLSLSHTQSVFHTPPTCVLSLFHSLSYGIQGILGVAFRVVDRSLPPDCRLFININKRRPFWKH